jgi:Tfp pilus assembly protein PilO
VGKPALADLPGIRHELAERRGQLEAFSAGSSMEAATRQLQAELDAAMPTITAAAVASGSELEVIVTLERLANSRNVLEQLQLDDPKPIGPSGWQERTLSITITGKFPAVAQYLADLRQLPWLLTFGSLSINRSDASNVRATLTGRLLWQPKR